MVELAALEKRYGASYRGFESLSLRQGELYKRDKWEDNNMKDFRKWLTRDNYKLIILFIAFWMPVIIFFQDCRRDN